MDGRFFLWGRQFQEVCVDFGDWERLCMNRQFVRDRRKHKRGRQWRERGCFICHIICNIIKFIFSMGLYPVEVERCNSNGDYGSTLL